MYSYTVNGIADLAGMTRNTLNVAKARGKIDPGDLRSVVSFLTRILIDQRLSGDLFGLATRVKKAVEQGKRGAVASRKKTKKARRGR